MSPFPWPPQCHSVVMSPFLGGCPRLPISSLDVQPNPHHARGPFWLPRSSQPGDDDIIAGWGHHSQVSAGRTTQSHGWIKRPLGAVLDSFHTIRQFQTPCIAGGGPAGNRKRDRFAGLPLSCQIFGRLMLRRSGWSRFLAHGWGHSSIGKKSYAKGRRRSDEKPHRREALETRRFRAMPACLKAWLKTLV